MKDNPSLDSFTAASFFALAQNAPDIICRFDQNYYHLYVNPAIEKITGVPPSVFIGKSTTQVGMSPEFAQLWNSQIKKVFDTQTPSLFEFNFSTPGGTKYFQSSVVPEFDEKGKVQTVLSISRDITLTREHEEEKDALVAVITHELKTPITSVKILAQLLQRRLSAAGDKETVSYLLKMDRQLDRLNKRISDLLDATRIGAGKMHFEKKLFSFKELLKEVVADMQKTTITHSILLDKTTPVKIFGDRERIGQVLLNLISNAIKYSPDSLPVAVSMEIAADMLTCCVHDSGSGIPQAKQEKLFQRFSRLTQKNHSDSPGLGLGLYISAEIIKKEGGKIWVESSKSKGTTFCFTLPTVMKIGKKKTTRYLDNERITISSEPSTVLSVER